MRGISRTIRRLTVAVQRIIRTGRTDARVPVEGTGDALDEYTFVLSGRREYELLCHRPASGDDGPCVQLQSTFRLT